MATSAVPLPAFLCPTVPVREGVIQFRAEHRSAALSQRRHADAATEIDCWRRILVDLGLVGTDPSRYEGLGFGNLSLRVGAPSSPRGRRAFLITCTQTGALPRVTLDNLALVERYSLVENRVHSQGPCKPSSEAMTHGAFYDISPAVRAVLHVHSPAIWRARQALRLPTTSESIGYGTPEMARSVDALMKSTAMWDRRVMAMGGHEDGIVAFGRSTGEAGTALVRCLAAAHRVAAF
jgi:ribulose-5-phosphate 4-epimerase/fuculose-1-phosphate aldolase